VGRRANALLTKIEEFARWKRWDHWQNVAVRNLVLWERSMLEFVQFAVADGGSLFSRKGLPMGLPLARGLDLTWFELT